MTTDSAPSGATGDSGAASAPGASGAAGLSTDELSSRLRSSGLRVTGPRLNVYRAMATAGGHRSADDVAATVATTGPALPRTSVYNALKALVGAGILDVVDAGPGTTLYEVRGADHHHFICRKCGALLDVPEDSTLGGSLRAELPGAIVESAQVLLRGVCPACASPA